MEERFQYKTKLAMEAFYNEGSFTRQQFMEASKESKFL